MVAAAADKPREAVVQVQDLVLSRRTSTESRQFADVHGTIRIPDNERVRTALRIEIEGGID
jgi:hypothetical protein